MRSLGLVALLLLLTGCAFWEPRDGQPEATKAETADDCTPRQLFTFRIRRDDLPQNTLEIWDFKTCELAPDALDLGGPRKVWVEFAGYGPEVPTQAQTLPRPVQPAEPPQEMNDPQEQ